MSSQPMWTNRSRNSGSDHLAEMIAARHSGTCPREAGVIGPRHLAILMGHPLSEHHVSPELVVNPLGPRLVPRRAIESRVLVDVEQLILGQRARISARPVDIERIWAREFRFDENEVAAGRIESDVRLRQRPLHGQIVLEPVRGRRSAGPRARTSLALRQSPEVQVGSAWIPAP